ncbi:kelch-like protein 4 [Paenibacillus sp. FSL R5-192]|uniref:fibronectin type III domain-containing protein n=1 Tax=Paenibacillus sp. FSL R5-192 TaxID=1226754 RepID=UPI0003E221BE|nr:fibronectin type III domain-containing protein [Paenibacillus sp. FSL R5-192]ETT30670.1 kelch-like protein 4 [Paenibacillus sp. FSL R5-192]
MKKNCLAFLTVLLIILLFSQSTTGAASPLSNKVDGMLGFSPPNGTEVKASSEYSTYIAKNVIDGKLKNEWNAGTYRGTIELKFPEAIEFNFVHISTAAEPIRSVTYQIYGLKDGTWTAISAKETQALSERFNTPPPVKVTQGVYEGIKIEGDGGSSWLAIDEITLGSFEYIKLNGSITGTTATLNWNTINDATGYKLQYGTESGKYTDSITVEGKDSSTYKVPNLEFGKTYYFQIVAIFHGVETVISNEVALTINNDNTETPTPEQPAGDRAILVVTMTTGLEKEFDLSMKEVNSFIDWYETKQAGSGKASYAIDKHDNNKGPFKSRKDYILFDRVLTFEVSEY